MVHPWCIPVVRELSQSERRLVTEWRTHTLIHVHWAWSHITDPFCLFKTAVVWALEIYYFHMGKSQWRPWMFLQNNMQCLFFRGILNWKSAWYQWTNCISALNVHKTDCPVKNVSNLLLISTEAPRGSEKKDSQAICTYVFLFQHTQRYL